MPEGPSLVMTHFRSEEKGLFFADFSKKERAKTKSLLYCRAVIFSDAKCFLFCLILLLVPVGKSVGSENSRAVPESWLDLSMGGESVGSAQGKASEQAGRLEHGTLLPEKGPGFVRLGGARINWGAGHLVSLLMNASKALQEREPGVLVHIGGLSFKKGGRFQPHKSHQNGLDADILFVGRGEWGSVLNPSREVTDRFDLEKNWEFWRLLTSQRIGGAENSESVVAMILVSPPIKERLCQWARSTGALNDELNREVMRRIRPTRGHDGHFHLRLHCSPFHRKCLRSKVLLAGGDGCDGPVAGLRPKKKKKISSGALEARS